MNNNSRSHVLADKIKWIIAFTLIAVLCVGMALAVVKLWVKPDLFEPSEETTTAAENTDTFAVKYNFAAVRQNVLNQSITALSSVENESKYVSFSFDSSTGVITLSADVDEISENWGLFIFDGSYDVTEGVLNAVYETKTKDFVMYIDTQDLVEQGILEYDMEYKVGSTLIGSSSDAPLGMVMEMGVVVGSFTLEKISELPDPPTKTGYTFTGWYTDPACTKPYTEDKVIGDITLYAGFRANTYTIVFNANTGSGSMDGQSMTYDTAANLTANAFTKDKYTFKGWATSAGGSVEYADGQSVKNLTAADGATISLYAVWELNSYTVTFKVDGQTTSTINVNIDASATLPEAPSKEGYNFVGWFYEDGTQYTNQGITADTVLTAKFEIIKCTVTFIVDGEVYARYECDYGTNLSELLGQNVNTLLYTTEGEYSPNF